MRENQLRADSAKLYAFYYNKRLCLIPGGTNLVVLRMFIWGSWLLGRGHGSLFRGTRNVGGIADPSNGQRGVKKQLLCMCGHSPCCAGKFSVPCAPVGTLLCVQVSSLESWGQEQETGGSRPVGKMVPIQNCDEGPCIFLSCAVLSLATLAVLTGKTPNISCTWACDSTCMFVSVKRTLRPNYPHEGRFIHFLLEQLFELT